MSTLKLSGALKVGSLSSAPSNPEVGFQYYDSTDSKYYQWDGSAWQESADTGNLGSTATGKGASLIGIEDSAAQFTGTNVEAALTEALDAAQAAQATADAAGVADDTAYNATSWDANTDASTKNALRDKFEADKLLIDANTAKISYTDSAAVSANTAKVSADGSVATHSDVTDAGSGAIITSGERTKLGNIETLADVTDSTNVAAAGAVMESDTTTALMSFVIDEDAMTSDSPTKIPTQQSVKAYVDSEVSSAIAGGAAFKGDYNASTNSPDLDSTPISTSIGDMYVVTVAGTFFTTDVEIGDMMIAESVDATTEAEWTIVQANLTPASIKTQYESNTNTNAFTDTEKTTLGNQSGTNTGDESAASTTAQGIVELATQAEVDTGSDTSRSLTPATFSGSSQMAAKLENLSEDTTPSLGGDLTLGDNTVIHDSNGMQRGTSATDFLEEEYIHSISLLASQTDTVITALTFAHASFEGLEMTYKVKEATTGNVRIGTIRVATNGTNVVLNDMSTETADLGVSFDAVVNGASINIRYTSDTNACTLRADVKRIKA